MAPNPNASPEAQGEWVTLNEKKTTKKPDVWRQANQRYCNAGPCHLLVYASANRTGDGTPLDQRVEYPILIDHKPQKAHLIINTVLDDGEPTDDKNQEIAIS